MFRGKNILAIGAHPDDIEYSAFGTLAKHREKIGLFIFIMSGGGLGDESSGKERIKESLKALELIQPNHIYTRKSLGVFSAAYHGLVSDIEGIIEKHQINLVIAPTKNDSHQDHRLVHDIVVTALRQTNADILFYNPLSRTLNFAPRLFVDITNWFDIKIAALMMHSSQLHKPYMRGEAIQSFNANSFTALFGIKYCEAFEVGRVFC